MTNALSWLNDLAQWLGRWVPRLVLVEPTHRGVRFGPRGTAIEVGPGLVIYWPITQALVLIPVTTQSTQLNAQIHPCDEDGTERIVPKVMLCAVAIQFRVHDAVKSAMRALHTFALVDNRAQAAVARHIGRGRDLAAWAAAAMNDLQTELEPFGVTVERLDFTQHGTGVALKNVSDWSYSEQTNGKRPD